jgi:hypothetical protein
MLELLGRYEVRSVVGLFDNDRAGAEQFNGLGPSHGFSDGEDALHRRHARGCVHAHLLLVPALRCDFALTQIPRRVLELEHYYSDDVLNRFGVADDVIYPGSKVFSIKDTAKSAFAEKAKALEATEFTNFAPLFARLLGILGIAAAQAGVTSA